MGIFSDLLNFLYPHCCLSCNHPLLKGEYFVCTSCQLHLPYTFYEEMPNNPVARSLYGRIPFCHASATFFFTQNSCIQQILHQLKYKGKSEMGFWLGMLMGQRISLSPFYQNVDYIIPLPLHPKKEKKRGYNQAEMISQGIEHAWILNSSRIQKPQVLPNLLYKPLQNESQTHKTRYERWHNVQHAFALNSSLSNNLSKMPPKHFLLIDDVITTGATLESAASVLLNLPGSQLSIATVASPV